MYHSPSRWDECLEIAQPLLIHSNCGPWEALCSNLWDSGLGTEHTSRLVEPSGEVYPLTWSEGGPDRTPSSDDWWLAINWTHPEEGWRARLPLSGRHYLVTRQKEQGKELVDRLSELGARATSSPTIEFHPPSDEQVVQDCIQRLADVDWLFFTSPNGVRYFFRALADSKRDHRSLGGAKFACIGPGTAAELEQQGFKTDLLPKEFVAEGLLDAVKSKLGSDLNGISILIPRAQEAREILPETLREWGAEVVVCPVYQTVVPDEQTFTSPLKTDSRLLFTSSSTVKHWVKAHPSSDVSCFCIGPVTARTAEELQLYVLGVAKVHSIEGLVDEILRVDGR